MKVKTYGDSQHTEFVEQGKGGNDSDLLNDIRDGYHVYSGIGGKFDRTSDGDSDCGCDQTSTPRKRLSPEYKMMWVVIGIVIAWSFVTWNHHSRIHHMRQRS